MENTRFKRSLFGFNKNDVYDHIENVYKTFDEQLKQKEEEINQLNKQNNMLRQQVSQMQDKLAGVEDYKSNIADVLLKAKQQGEEILKEAIREAENKKREFEEYMQGEKEKLNLVRNELNSVKQSAVELLRKYEKDLEELSNTNNEL